MAAAGRSRDDRVSRERVRVYQARQEFHASVARRRTRDNLVAGLAGGVLILAVVAGQVAYFTAGPGVPAPEPTSTSTPSPTPTTSSDPEPTATDAPTPTPTP